MMREYGRRIKIKKNGQSKQLLQVINNLISFQKKVMLLKATFKMINMHYNN